MTDESRNSTPIGRNGEFTEEEVNEIKQQLTMISMKNQDSGRGKSVVENTKCNRNRKWKVGKGKPSKSS